MYVLGQKKQQQSQHNKHKTKEIGELIKKGENFNSNFGGRLEHSPCNAKNYKLDPSHLPLNV